MLMKTLGRQFCPRTLTIVFPEVLDNMIEAERAHNWEIWKSKRIQPCRIEYQGNVASTRIGLILIHTACRSKFHNLRGEERKETLKKAYVDIKKRKKGWTEKTAAAEYDNLSVEDKHYQDQQLLSDRQYDDAEKRGVYAK